MRKRRAPVTTTTGFIAGLVREALEDGQEVERYKLHQAVGVLAKVKHGKRNSPQYRMVEESFTALVKAGLIETRYVPFHLMPDDPKYGKTYYKKAS